MTCSNHLGTLSLLLELMVHSSMAMRITQLPPTVANQPARAPPYGSRLLPHKDSWDAAWATEASIDGLVGQLAGVSEAAPTPVVEIEDAATPDFTGNWHLKSREGMDTFLKAMGVNWVARAAAQRAGQVQEITQLPNQIQVVSRDLRGTTSLQLPFGEGVLTHDGDGGRPVVRRAFWHHHTLVIEERAPESEGGQLLSTCKRSLENTHMVLSLSKTTNGVTHHMRVIFERV